MFAKLKAKFKREPSFYYAMSICATWAGAGSILVGMSMAQTYGILPFVLWAFGNTITCILLGIFSHKLPILKTIMLSRPMKIIMGFMCIFQVWVNMSGIHDALASTMIGETAASIITYAIAIAFMLFFLKNTMMRNVLSDHSGWWVVMLLMVGLTFVAITCNGATPLVGVPLTDEGLISGITKCIYLIPGSFLYPVFWQMLEYNKSNEDGTKSVNMRKAFIWGGLLFGAYLCFVFLMSMTTFNPVMNLIKGIMISIIAISSLSSFIYSMYITFGKKVGVVMNTLTIGSWFFLIPMGVMAIWTKMQEVRFLIVIVCIIIAIVWAILAKSGKDKVLIEKIKSIGRKKNKEDNSQDGGDLE